MRTINTDGFSQLMRFKCAKFVGRYLRELISLKMAAPLAHDTRQNRLSVASWKVKEQNLLIIFLERSYNMEISKSETPAYESGKSGKVQ